MRYRFVGGHPRVFTHLTHSPDVTVERDGSVLAGDEGEDGTPEPLTHTVELHPGDVLNVPAVEVHVELEPDDAATVAAHAALEQPPDNPPAPSRTRRPRS